MPEVNARNWGSSGLARRAENGIVPSDLAGGRRRAMNFGTWLHTKLHGEKVGEDAYGNVYYKSKRKRFAGREERWVIYTGEAEASKVPPEWHAWLHHTTDAPLSAPMRSWQKP